MKFVLKLRYSVQLADLSSDSDLGHNSPGRSMSANNVSVMLGLCSYIAYECIPRFVLGVGRGGDSRWTLLESPTFGYDVGV
jgi:hypothetical protein